MATPARTASVGHKLVYRVLAALVTSLGAAYALPLHAASVRKAHNTEALSLGPRGWTDPTKRRRCGGI